MYRLIVLVLLAAAAVVAFAACGDRWGETPLHVLTMQKAETPSTYEFTQPSMFFDWEWKSGMQYGSKGAVGEDVYVSPDQKHTVIAWNLIWDKEGERNYGGPTVAAVVQVYDENPGDEFLNYTISTLGFSKDGSWSELLPLRGTYASEEQCWSISNLQQDLGRLLEKLFKRAGLSSQDVRNAMPKIQGTTLFSGYSCP